MVFVGAGTGKSRDIKAMSGGDKLELSFLC